MSILGTAQSSEKGPSPSLHSRVNGRRRNSLFIPNLIPMEYTEFVRSPAVRLRTIIKTYVLRQSDGGLLQRIPVCLKWAHLPQRPDSAGTLDLARRKRCQELSVCHGFS